MAEKRMFTQKICDSDAFLDMPLTTQALYFHLNMRADDDGFVNNPKKIQRMIGASEDDLKLLVLKRFILTFDNGVIVIKHWRMHNLLRKDRYHPTQYQEELALLDLKENGSYTEKLSGNTEVIELATNWQPTGNQSATEVRLGKVRLGKVSVVEGSVVENSTPEPAHAHTAKTTYESLCDEYGKLFVDERIKRAKTAKYKVTDVIDIVAKWCEEDAGNVARQSPDTSTDGAKSRSLEEEGEEDKKEIRGRVEENTELPPPPPQTDYECLCQKYGKSFVDERVTRAKKYSGTTMATVAKWCEEDAAAGRTKKTKFSNFPNRDYDVSDLERKLLMSGQG